MKNIGTQETNGLLFDEVTGMPVLEPVLQLTQEWLQEFAASPEFVDKMQLAFGDGVNVASLQDVWASGSLGTLPEIEVRSAAEINGANGAFAAATNTIYLAQELLSESVEQVAQVFLEEYGHYVDSLLTPGDALGDEGAMFSYLVQGQNLNESEITTLQVENDIAVTNLNNQLVKLEQKEEQDQSVLSFGIPVFLTGNIGIGSVTLTSSYVWDTTFDSPLSFLPKIMTTVGGGPGLGFPDISLGVGVPMLIGTSLENLNGFGLEVSKSIGGAVPPVFGKGIEVGWAVIKGLDLDFDNFIPVDFNFTYTGVHAKEFIFGLTTSVPTGPFGISGGVFAELTGTVISEQRYIPTLGLPIPPIPAQALLELPENLWDVLQTSFNGLQDFCNSVEVDCGEVLLALATAGPQVATIVAVHDIAGDRFSDALTIMREFSVEDITNLIPDLSLSASSLEIQSASTNSSSLVSIPALDIPDIDFDILQALVELGSDAWDFVTNLPQSTFNTVENLSNDALEALSDIQEAAGDQLPEAINAAKTVHDIAGDQFNQVLEELEGLPDGVFDAIHELSEVGEAVQDFVGDVDVISDLSTTISDLPGAITDFVADLVSDIPASFSGEILNEFLEAAPDFPSLSEIPSDILNTAFENFPISTDILTELPDFSSTDDNLLETVQDLIPDTILNTIEFVDVEGVLADLSSVLSGTNFFNTLNQIFPDVFFDDLKNLINDPQGSLNSILNSLSEETIPDSFPDIIPIDEFPGLFPAAGDISSLLSQLIEVEEPPVFTEFDVDTGNPFNLANALLATNSGMTVNPDSINFQGGAGATSFYHGNLEELGIDSGILLTSGDGTPPLENTSPDYTISLDLPGDSDLDEVADNAFPGSGGTFDANTLEFSFNIDDPSVKAIKVSLVFGSDEFPEFSNTDFVDAAAVLVNGENVAFFDQNKNQPLSVIDANLEQGNFINNEASGFEGEFEGQTKDLPIEYDGVSSPLTIIAPVQQGENTIKFGVADTGDTLFDSGLFASNLQAFDLGSQFFELPAGALLLDVLGSTVADDLTGTDVNEFIDALGGDDTIDPGAGNDFVSAGAGNDTIQGGQGNNQINGGSGTDIAVYPGLFAETPIQVNEDIVTVGNGTDTLTKVEFLQFSDTTVSTTFLDTLSLTVTDAEQPEGDDGTTSFTFTVTRPDNVTGDIEFNYEVTGSGDNPADADDFGGTLPSGTITFTGEETEKQITIDVTGDTVVEPDEAFTLTLRSPDAGEDVTQPTATAIIINDDVEQPNDITGTPGRDQLTGTSENDSLTGSFGADILTGEAGSDQFIYNSIRDAGDTITDFEVGNDQIVLTEVLDSFGYDGSDALADGYVQVVEMGSNSVVQIDSDGPDGRGIFRPFILVENVAAADLSAASNFAF